MSRIRLKAATPYAFTIVIMGVLGIVQHTSQAAADEPQYVTPDYPIDGWQNIKQGFSQAWRNTREGASTAWQQVQQGAQRPVSGRVRPGSRPQAAQAMIPPRIEQRMQAIGQRMMRTEAAVLRSAHAARPCRLVPCRTRNGRITDRSLPLD